jgi:hypothetical protein
MVYVVFGKNDGGRENGACEAAAAGLVAAGFSQHGIMVLFKHQLVMRLSVIRAGFLLL